MGKNIVKGYKAMNADMTCRGFQFEVGKTYNTLDTLAMCLTGFHFCLNVFDVYSYYPKTADTIICEVEALGQVTTEGDKSVTNKLKVIKKLSDKELLTLWINKTNSGDWNSGNRNSGYGNSGYGNSGNRNSGDWNSGNGNSGYGNSGDGNSGDGNSGYGNSGYGNSGNRNSGDWNSGNRNSGYGNSGNRNSGDWNSGDGNSGYFNTKIPVYLFNLPCDMQWTQDFENRIRSLNVKPILEWIPSSQMTDKEKDNNKSYTVTGGFLRKTSRHNWKHLTDDDKKFIKALPNFDDRVFKKITGISLLDSEPEEDNVND